MEEFLMQDEEELNIWPENLAIDDNLSLSVDDWWDFGLTEFGGFNSDILSLLEEGEFMMQPELPVGFMDEGESNFLSHQYLQQEQQKQLHQPQQQVDEEKDEEVDVEGEDKNPEEGNSKNLVSERNRRKRLNRQLFTLRSLVPNITKMDKQSILVDALAYLQTTLQQIKEMEKSEPSSSSSCIDSRSLSVRVDKSPPVQTQQFDRCAALPSISKVEGEMLDEERFIVKIGCNKAMGALGLVHRVIDMLGLDITCISVTELNQDNMLMTAFLHVKKKGVVTQEKLLHCVTANARRLDLIPPDSA